jgi:hypothetical protein
MEAVDQLLFGYRDGHQLLAASRTISPRQQRELLPHVDASFERSDARQLVGIGVPALDAYLLGAIWPAPERPRPGAVWAHALLIGTDQLARLPLLGLLTLLERPRDDHLERYSRRLPWPALPRDGARLAPFSRALAWALHSTDPSPVIVLWDFPDVAEGALLALLDETPGPERMALSFRTRESARPSSPYRIQVASDVSGQLGAAREILIDPRYSGPDSVSATG